METTTEEYNRRLLVLADFLEKLPPEKFNYASFLDQAQCDTDVWSCGSTACAIGWVPYVEEFKGLANFMGPGPHYTSFQYESLGINLFGISIKEFFYLFYGDALLTEEGTYSSGLIDKDEYGEVLREMSEVSKQEVVDHIRDFVKRRS